MSYAVAPLRDLHMRALHCCCGHIFFRYGFKLCLYVGVDSQNKTIVFAQGFMSNEQAESFDFVNKVFVEICGGHPKVSVLRACRWHIGGGVA